MSPVRLLSFVLLIALSSTASAQTSVKRKQVLERLLEEHRGPNFAIVTARLLLDRDTALAYRQLDTLLEREYGDMFWMYGCAGLYTFTQDVLRPLYKEKIRKAWKRFTPYRGDTENHFLMYYGSLLLMSEVWPGLPASEWFNGKSSEANHRESEEYLTHWIQDAARWGQIEFDSPRYQYYFLTPLVMLANQARSPMLYRMMLECTVADYAAEYLARSYAGAHSRNSETAALQPRLAEVTAYGDYFFEDSVIALQPDVAFAVLGMWSLPEQIREIARDRKEPYTHLELKQGRKPIRYVDAVRRWVHKKTYVTERYAMGSLEGGISQPIQQQSWSLVFNDTMRFNSITALHPNVEASELAAYFPEYPQFILDRIGSTKAGYPSENKWVGGSPYQRIYQDKNMLLDIYDIPKAASYQHVDLFIPGAAKGVQDFLSESVQTPRWLAINIAGQLVGIHPLSEFTLRPEGENFRLRAFGGTTGFWVYLLREGRQADAMLTLKSRRTARGTQYIGLDGEIVVVPNKHPNQRPTSGGTTKTLYDSPFMRSRAGSGVIEVGRKDAAIVYDFNRGHIR